jgi:hypothetical protein
VGELSGAITRFARGSVVRPTDRGGVFVLPQHFDLAFPEVGEVDFILLG